MALGRLLLCCGITLASNCGWSAGLADAADAGKTRALVVSGLGGTADYERDFQRQARITADALRDVADDVTLLLGDMVDGDRLRDELAALAARAAVEDTLVVVLVGHGSFDERDYRFNIPGPDVTGVELGGWLAAVPADRQIVVAATSASGALLEPLQAPRRTLVTATRSGGERNATVFARYLAESLGEAGADTDKDGYVSALEAFRFAEHRVTGHYAERNEMATEHPALQGPEPTVRFARLERPAGFAETASAGRAAELEAAIEALRADKANRDPNAYFAELQRLLLELAMLRRDGPEASP